LSGASAVPLRSRGGGAEAGGDSGAACRFRTIRRRSRSQYRVGLQRGGYRRVAHRVGARSRRGARLRADELLRGTAFLVTAAGSGGASADALSDAGLKRAAGYAGLTGRKACPTFRTDEGRDQDDALRDGREPDGVSPSVLLTLKVGQALRLSRLLKRFIRAPDILRE